MTLVGGKTTDAMAQFYSDLNDNQQVTETCGHCGWSFTGAFCMGRELFDSHMADAHPEVRLHRKKRHREISRFKQLAAERAAHMAETEAA